MNRRFLPLQSRRRPSGTPSNTENQSPLHNSCNDGKGRRHQVGERDVVCGRGRSIEILPGNVNFRDLVQSHQVEYENSKANCKRDVAKRIVALVQAEGGRFLKKVVSYKDKNGTSVFSLEETSDCQAVAKVCQAFRDLHRQQQLPANKPENREPRSKLRIRIKLNPHPHDTRSTANSVSSLKSNATIKTLNKRCLPLRQNLESANGPLSAPTTGFTPGVKCA